jgi:hypothetical protein
MEPNTTVELSFEKDFEIHKFNSLVDVMSHEDAQSFLKDLYRQMMVKDALYQSILKEAWGLDAPRM